MKSLLEAQEKLFEETSPLAFSGREWAKSFLRQSNLAVIAEVVKKCEEKAQKLPYESKYCQNRNGLYYCGTCEQAWDDCSCSARNTGYKRALTDFASDLRATLQDSTN